MLDLQRIQQNEAADDYFNEEIRTQRFMKSFKPLIIFFSIMSRCLLVTN